MMTRDEAVKMLQATKLMLMDGANHPISDLYYALDMAIEALEQTEPQTIRCPKCGRSDYIREFGKDFSVTAEEAGFKYKCINCNTYIEPQSDRKTKNCSEKPNNCEHITEDGVTCAKYPACDYCLDNPLNKVKGSERLVKGSEQTDLVEDSPSLVKDLVKAFGEDGTWLERQGVYTLTLAEAKQRAVDIIESVLAKDEPTISKMEQVEDETQKLDCRNKKYYSSCEYANKCHPTVCFKALDEFKEKLKDEPQPIIDCK